VKRLLILALVVAGCGGAAQSASTGPRLGGPSAAPSGGVLAERTDPTDAPDVVFDFAVKVTKRTASVARNARASVTIKTTTGAECGIDVQYPSGSSTADGLEPQTANASGAITWKWVVTRDVKKGSVPIVITCTLGDQSGRADTSFKVK
jgi:micrococcal nuclease